jgi:hypothetical protein
LVTTAKRRDAQLLRARGFTLVELHPKSPESAERIVASIAAARHRQLSASVVGHLVTIARSPLWLRLAVDELIALGGADFLVSERRGEASPEAMLSRVASTLPESETKLVERSIRRAEERLGADIVDLYLSLHAVSRFGFAPADTKQMLAVSDLQIAELNRALAPLVERRDSEGRLGFRNDVIRRTAEAFTADLEQQSRGLAIAALREAKIRSRTADLELLHQCLYVPGVAAEVLPELFSRFPPEFDLTRDAQRLVLDVLRRQAPNDTGVRALAAGIERDAANQKHIAAGIRRRVISYRPTGRDFLRGVWYDAPADFPTEISARLADLASPEEAPTSTKG